MVRRARLRADHPPVRHVLRLSGRTPRALPGRFFDRPVLEVARDLLGRTLVRRLPGRIVLAGRIVEVEAYDGPADRASHASRGRTARNAPMFGPAGRAYVYLVYGMHCCLNVVTGPVGYPAAILIRAVEPLGESVGLPSGGSSDRDRARLASGPGRLTRALRIDRKHDRADLCREGPIYLADGPTVPGREMLAGPRIGVPYAGAWARRRFRFGVRGSAALSHPFPSR